MGSVLGGGGGSSSSKSGYAALPKELKDAFNKLGINVEQYTNPSNAGVTEAFTPQGVTAGEQGAMDAINRGFTPTAESIQSDIAMQMNPFDTYVIDEINRQGMGDYSILKQALSESGQQGSNRQALGANDIDLTRLNQIGQFKQGQYNTALQNSLGTLTKSRQSDAGSQLGVGDFLRTLDLQTKQAPVNALSAGTSMISPFTSGGTQSSNTQGDTLGSLGKIIGTIGSFFI